MPWKQRGAQAGTVLRRVSLIGPRNDAWTDAMPSASVVTATRGKKTSPFKPIPLKKYCFRLKRIAKPKAQNQKNKVVKKYVVGILADVSLPRNAWYYHGVHAQKKARVYATSRQDQRKELEYVSHQGARGMCSDIGQQGKEVFGYAGLTGVHRIMCSNMHCGGSFLKKKSSYISLVIQDPWNHSPALYEPRKALKGGPCQIIKTSHDASLFLNIFLGGLVISKGIGGNINQLGGSNIMTDASSYEKVYVPKKSRFRCVHPSQREWSFVRQDGCGVYLTTLGDPSWKTGGIKKKQQSEISIKNNKSD